MTWSSGSTSRGLGFSISASLLGLTLLGGGCATRHQPALPPPVQGYVNLDVLTRQHPGWSGVGRYDAALRRLENAARSLPPTDRPDQKIATLPAPTLMAAGDGAALPAADAGQVGRQLRSKQQFLLEELRARREAARRNQLQGRQGVWARDARQMYPLPTGTAVTEPDLDLQLLQANVETLTRTLDGWKQSVPPAPKREALRMKVEAERSRLETLIAQRLAAKDLLRTQYAAEVKRLRQGRVAYVQTQSDSLAAHLRDQDAHFITGQQARLTEQREGLLTALARPVPLSVPDVGDAGTLTLPKGPGSAQAALSRASLIEAETHLTSQRARWIRHLYEDTKAAARDTADQHRWAVTFGPPRPGERDLTQALAQALRAGSWRL